MDRLEDPMTRTDSLHKKKDTRGTWADYYIAPTEDNNHDNNQNDTESGCQHQKSGAGN